MAGTWFGFDVIALETGTKNPLAIFTDCEITLDIETDQARAAQDIKDGTTQGFDVAVQKAKSWSVRLGAVLDGSLSGNAVESRAFGWDMTTVNLAGDIKSVFTRAAITIRNECVDARATYDTFTSDTAWRVYRMARSSIEIEAEGVVTTADMFQAAISDSNWNPGTAVIYRLTGGGVDIGGDAVIAGGSYTVPLDAASQGIRLIGRGFPTTHVDSGGVTAPKLILMALERDAMDFSISKPGGGTYFGSAFLTEARLEAPDGACLQNATFQGSGILDIGA